MMQHNDTQQIFKNATECLVSQTNSNEYVQSSNQEMRCCSHRLLLAVVEADDISCLHLYLN